MLSNPDLTYTLTKGDQIVCQELAEARYSSNRQNAIEDKKIGKQSVEFTDLQGISGEFAFCRLFNLEPDRTIHPRSTKKDKGDTELPNGKIIDIKTTHYSSGKLLATTWKKDTNVDYFALMVGTFPKYEFKGYLPSEELLQKDRLIDLGYGPTYAAEQYELKIDTDFLK